jgi:hypothetical protein
MGIGEDIFYLRFEDRDVQEIERTISLFVAFHPVNRTYENASMFLWRGLRKKTDAGELEYVIQQNEAGKPAALEKVKEFTRQFEGIVGIALLYGYIERALVVAGWFGEPKEGPPEKPTSKNSVPPTGKRGRKQRSG